MAGKSDHNFDHNASELVRMCLNGHVPGTQALCGSVPCPRRRRRASRGFRLSPISTQRDPLPRTRNSESLSSAFVFVCPDPASFAHVGAGMGVNTWRGRRSVADVPPFTRSAPQRPGNEQHAYRSQCNRRPYGIEEPCGVAEMPDLRLGSPAQPWRRLSHVSRPSSRLVGSVGGQERWQTRWNLV